MFSIKIPKFHITVRGRLMEQISRLQQFTDKGWQQLARINDELLSSGTQLTEESYPYSLMDDLATFSHRCLPDISVPAELDDYAKALNKLYEQAYELYRKHEFLADTVLNDSLKDYANDLLNSPTISALQTNGIDLALCVFSRRLIVELNKTKSLLTLFKAK